MNIIDHIKDWVYKKSLTKLLPKKRIVLDMNIEQAQQIGILFDASLIDDRKTINRYVENLRKKGKKISLLGYIPIAEEGATFDFDFYTNKDIDWAQRIKETATKKFLGRSYDLFICIAGNTLKTTEYISLQTKAVMRIGPVSEHPACYDLMIDCPSGTTPLQFIKQYETILELALV